MKIVFHAYGHESGSTYIMCEDMAAVFRQWGHDTTIVTSTGKIPHSDLLICTHPGSMLQIRRTAGRYFKADRVVLLFTPHPWGFNNAELAAGILTAEEYPVVCHSPLLYDLLGQRVRTLFAPAVARRVLGNMHLIPFGILDAFRDTDQNDSLHWIAPFNRCSDSDKNFTEHAQLTARLNVLFPKKFGQTVTTHLHYAHPKLSHVEERNVSMYEARPQPETRQGYIEEIRQYGAFVCMSEAESFGLYYLELLASGVVGLFKDREWVHRLLPSYKLVAERKDLPDLACRVFADYDMARQYLKEKVQPYIDREYRLTRFCEQFLTVE